MFGAEEIVVVYLRSPINQQLRELYRGVDVSVGTPGSLSIQEKSFEAVEDIKEMFKKIDIDENDTVTIEELKILLQKLNLQLADSEIQLLIEAVTLLTFLKCDSCFSGRGGTGGNNFRMSLGLRVAATVNCADNTGAKNSQGG